MHWAALRGDLESMHKALWEGAEVDARDLQDGWTPLQLAAMRGHDSCVQLLVVKGANVNSRDNYGGTAAHKAASNGHLFSLSTFRSNLRGPGAKGGAATDLSILMRSPPRPAPPSLPNAHARASHCSLPRASPLHRVVDG